MTSSSVLRGTITIMEQAEEPFAVVLPCGCCSIVSARAGREDHVAALLGAENAMASRAVSESAKRALDDE